MRLQPHTEALVGALLDSDVCVYLQGFDAATTAFRDSGCAAHDFPRVPPMQGTGFTVPEFPDHPYDAPIEIKNGGEGFITESKQLLRISYLHDGVAVFFFFAKEPRKYTSVYARHVPLGTDLSDKKSDIEFHLDVAESTPEHSYAVVYVPRILEHESSVSSDNLKGLMGSLLAHRLIPNENYGVILCEAGFDEFCATTFGYFGDKTNKAPLIDVPMAFDAKVELVDFLVLLREYRARPEKKKVAALHTKMKEVSQILLGFIGALPNFVRPADWQTIEERFLIAAQRYIDLRQERLKKNPVSRALTSSGFKADPDLVSELLAAINYVFLCTHVHPP
ncbi:MAG: hypothetical protein K0U29_00285 [Gammaproteobacteria bacterium]|nr:hypothetical protein [Gammaproteobacteria bacterium]MCH9743344.1 hypothetical protein [Gammaproteobacteria bacterium]